MVGSQRPDELARSASYFLRQLDVSAGMAIRESAQAPLRRAISRFFALPAASHPHKSRWHLAAKWQVRQSALLLSTPRLPRWHGPHAEQKPTTKISPVPFAYLLLSQLRSASTWLGAVRRERAALRWARVWFWISRWASSPVQSCR